MEPMGRLAEMDAKGILPSASELTPEYLHRCYRMLTLAANPKWVRRFMSTHLGLACTRNTFSQALFPAPATSRVAKFRKGIRRFGELTHSDLSWVPVFGFTEEAVLGETAGIQITRGTGEPDIPMWMLGVNVKSNFFPYSAMGTGAHEAFHALRWPMEDAETDAGAEEYGHSGHLLTEWWQRWAPCTQEQKDFIHAHDILRRHLGKDAWYVLVRLSYDEVVEHILNEDNPREYLRHAAGTSLRHRIMCHRLNLWR